MSGLVARTPVQGSGNFLSAKVQATYDRTLLMRAVDELMFDKYGQTKSIQAGQNTKKAFAYRYKGMLPATTPLAEYNGSNIKAPNKVVREEIEYQVAHYGDYIIYTDELDLYDYDNIKSSFLDLLGDQAGLTMDTIYRDVLRSGTNVIYVDQGTNRSNVATNTKKHTPADFKLMAVKLKNQGAKKFKKVIAGGTGIGTKAIRSAYLGIISPEVTEDLRELTGWKDVEDYADYSKRVDDNEVGSWGDFRMIENQNNAPVDEGGTNVYLSYFFGQNAYATTSLRGKKGIETIVKPLNSGGAENPLNQYGSVGWKAIGGAVILNEAWLIRTECTASIEDGTQKHYYDYS